MWPPGCSPLVFPPSQEVGSAWVSLSFISCRCTGKGVFQRNYNPSRAFKIYGHNALQITHLHTTVVNSDRATQLTTAHIVGLRCGAILSADCGYNPGWCLSHPPSPKWPKMCRVGHQISLYPLPIPTDPTTFPKHWLLGVLSLSADVGGSVPMFHLHGETARCQAVSALFQVVLLHLHSCKILVSCHFF